MVNRWIPLVALMCMGAKCGTPSTVGVWGEFRLDGLEDKDLIDSHDTRMCVAPDGTVYVVWIDDRTGVPEVWLNRQLASAEGAKAGWLPEAKLVSHGNTPPGETTSSVWNPNVACTDSQVYVVWEDDRDGETESHQVYFNMSPAGGEAFLPTDRLLETDEDGRTNSFNPQIAADGPSVFVTWSDNQNGAFDILFARSTDSGNTWQDPIRIDSDQPAGGAFSAFPQIATGQGGSNVYITWEDFRNGEGETGGLDIYFARSTDRGQSFSPDARLDTSDDPGAHNSFVPKISADNDDIYIVWHDDRFGDSNDGFMVYSGDAGITWSIDSRIDQGDTAGFAQTLYPKVCTSGSTGHISYHDNRGTGLYRAYYHRAKGGNWDGDEVRVDAYKADDQRPSRNTQIACEGENVLVAWLDELADLEEKGYNDIVYNYSADGGVSWLEDPTSVSSQDNLKWYRIDSVLEGTAYKTDLNLSIKGDEIKAAWTDGRAGSTDIYFQKIIAGEKALPLVPEQAE